MNSSLLLKPLVSICCHTYNHQNFIRDAVEGFLMQETTFPIEIIIHDDCSTDSTPSIISDYQQKHPNLIKLILQSENQYSKGVKPHLTSFKEVRGRYIALCEGDDYWTDPLKLQKQVDFLEANNEFSLVFCNVQVIYSSNSQESHLGYADHAIPANDGYLQILKRPHQVTTLEDLVYGNYIHTPGVVFRNWFLTDHIPNYMKKVPIADWPLHLFSATKGKLFYMNEALAAYRVHEGGIWSQKNRSQQLRYVILQYPPLISSGIFPKKIEKQLKNNTLNVFEELIDKTQTRIDFKENFHVATKIILHWKLFPLHIFVKFVFKHYLKIKTRFNNLLHRLARKFKTL